MSLHGMARSNIRKRQPVRVFVVSFTTQTTNNCRNLFFVLAVRARICVFTFLLRYQSAIQRGTGNGHLKPTPTHCRIVAEVVVPRQDSAQSTKNKAYLCTAHSLLTGVRYFLCVCAHVAHKQRATIPFGGCSLWACVTYLLLLARYGTTR